MTALIVTACGPMTSLQDSGRLGWQRFGLSKSGAMDRLALATANALVGNAPGVGAIEFQLMGGAFRIEGGDARVAVGGASCPVAVDGQSVAASTSLTIRDGQVLTIRPARAGVYAYLAVAGGFAVPPQLGSLSLQPRAGIGGYQGRPLREDDRLDLALDRAPKGPELALDPVPLEPDAPVRIVLGPQADAFTMEGIETLLSATYTVSREADRMGYRLSGPRIAHARGFNIVSDGIVPGSIQVPGAGEPIVMMADSQTTGGYPKVATMISADLRILAHRRPGDAVRFAAIDVTAAQVVARERAARIAVLAQRARPVRGGWPPSEELLALNLAGAAVNALGFEG